jgi:hypothetical protein
MLLMNNQTKEAVQRCEMTLKTTFERTLEYVEMDKDHPFLEEVVSIFANFFENIGSYQNAFLMWSKFLRIQQAMFGKDKDQMITTYKKLAALAVSIGESTASAKYLEKAEELMAASPETIKTEDMTPEQKKEHLEEKGALSFQQYMAAQQQQDFVKALMFIQRQTECL